MQKKQSVTILIVVIVVVLGLGYWFFIKPDRPQPATGPDKPQPTTSPDKPRPNASGQEFEQCVQASSLKDYCKKANIELCQEPNWLEGAETPIAAPIKMNYANVTIHKIPAGLAGGDVLTIQMLVVKGNYCQITEGNLNKLFAPIAVEDAVEYMIFRFVTLASSSYGSVRETIYTTDQYDKENSYVGCPKPIKDREITELLAEKDDHYIITWIYYDPTYRSGFFDPKVKVKKDGRIEILNSPQEPFIDCGPGIMF